MAELIRTGLSLDQDLLNDFDRSIEHKGYHNRSEAIRDLIRDHLITREVDQDRIVVAHCNRVTVD
jgi:CopG family nickel-responsive transcriptional regulator